VQLYRWTNRKRLGSLLLVIVALGGCGSSTAQSSEPAPVLSVSTSDVFDLCDRIVRPVVGAEFDQTIVLGGSVLVPPETRARRVWGERSVLEGRLGGCALLQSIFPEDELRTQVDVYVDLVSQEFYAMEVLVDGDSAIPGNGATWVKFAVG